MASTVIVDDFSSATTNGMPNPIFGCTPGSGQGTCFITDTNVAQSVLGSTTVIDAPLADVLGGSRTLTVVADSLQSVTPPDLVVAGVVPLVSFLEYDSTSQADGRVELRYNGQGAGLNLALTLHSGIRVIILDADDAAVNCEGGVLNCTPGYEVTVTLTDAEEGGHVASATKNVLLPGGPLALTFPVSDLSGLQGLQLNSIFSIRVAINPNTAGDLRLDRIEIFQDTQSAPLVSWWVIVLMLVVLTIIASRRLASDRG
ncbi:MAG TPA: hypothetical protein VMW17_16340 [Candidatus Binatia bacterium]|nr:hypothetical protein [Candidatus Binatia bacterium]